MELLIALNTVDALHSVKVIFFNLSESFCHILEFTKVALLHISVDLLIEVVFLLLHLALGSFQLGFKRLDFVIDVALAPLDLEVEGVVSGFVEVLFEPLVGFFKKLV